VDPRNGRLAGNPGQTAMNVAGIEMPRSYGLPAMGSGPGTDHFEQTIVDIEIWRLCRKAHAGIVVDEDRWLDEVREAVAALLTTHEPLPLGDEIEGELARLRGRAAG